MIGQSIAIVSGRPEVYGGYHALILDTEEINSYATAGGHILVSKGMIRLSQDEDILAAALAHSVSHIVLGHGTASIKRTRLLKMSHILFKALGSGSPSSQGWKVTNDLSDSFYDQMDASLTVGEQEKQYEAADKMAIELMQRLGYCEESLIKLLTSLRMRLRGSNKMNSK
jgi:beta-barrel assembly-enhancing protease